MGENRKCCVKKAMLTNILHSALQMRNSILEVCKMFYVSLMITTKQKPVVDKDKEKGIKAHHHRKSSNHKGRERGEGKKE